MSVTITFSRIFIFAAVLLAAILLPLQYIFGVSLTELLLFWGSSFLAIIVPGCAVYLWLVAERRIRLIELIGHGASFGMVIYVLSFMLGKISDNDYFQTVTERLKLIAVMCAVWIINFDSRV